MKIALKIAKVELKNMYCSPVAWVVLVIFAVQAGFVYTGVFEEGFSRQVLHYANFDLSRDLFSRSMIAVFPTIEKYLFLYLPLITMGLISQEINSGTIKLLYSSPVSIRQIVWGKYIAMMVYGAALVGILAVQVSFSMFAVAHFDLPATLSGLLGIYLLICTYAAIGLFISSIFSSQVVVAIATFAVLGILNYIGSVGQTIPFLREITFWMSIKGRTNDMTQGLINSEDVLYFIIVSGLFLSLSIKYLNFIKVHRSVLNQAGSYLLTLLVAVVLGALSFQPRLMYYYDATATKSMSLKPEHQTILEKMTGGATITTYVNLFDDKAGGALPQNVMNDKKFFKDYVRFKPDLKLKYVYYYNNPEITDNKQMYSVARKLAIRDRTNINDFMGPDEINKVIDLSGENYQFVRLIERDNGQKTWLRLFNDMQRYPGEPEIMAAFMRVSEKLPKVGFLSGHGERSITRTLNKDYNFFSQANNYRQALTNEGFDVQTIDLNQQKDMLARISILVIADVQTCLQPWELNQVNKFITSGGNLLIAGDEGTNDNINTITEPLGVKFSQGLLIQPHRDELPDLIMADVKPEATKLDSSFYWMLKGHEEVKLNGATSLNTDSSKGFNVVPLLATTTAGSWMVKDKNSISLENLQAESNAGRVGRENLLSVALTREVNNKEQRIVFIGDADFLSSGELKNNVMSFHSSNSDFIKNMFKWFSYGKIPIEAGRKMGKDNMFQFTSARIMPMHIFFWILIPMVLLLIGGLILYQRKKR